MEQRGRKSAASLAVISGGLAKRVEPPADMPAAQAALWREVVATKPPEWFPADSLPLLSAYCNACVEHQRTARALQSFQDEWLADPEGLARYQELSKAQDRWAKLMASLATKMRLTQQSRYNAKNSDTAARRAQSVSGPARPWDSLPVGSGTSTG